MANKILKTKIQLRNDTLTNWTSVNPKLSKGEIGIVFDTTNNLTKFKIGDGTTLWKDLDYCDINEIKDILKNDYYTITQIDNFFVKDSEFKSKVKAYVNDNNIVDQSYVDSKLASVYHFKGTLSTYETESTLTLKLPDSPSVGDVYNVAVKFATNNSFVEYDSEKGPVIYEAGTNIAYTNAGNWDILGGSLDLSNYATTSDVDNKLAKKVDVVDGKGLSSLDFNQVLKTTYDNAAEKAHTHSNKTQLDKITESYINAMSSYSSNASDILGVTNSYKTRSTGSGVLGDKIIDTDDIVTLNCGDAAGSYE